ncbi:uncharacterized protein C8R40DRAFT_1162175 [Lentinula edodes]|uniref:uncharacterized protein n=1 Tax=Lentinula edodes TaxID=5353 RepID=UPI001E8EAE60|nr:uncharacterized protein C8R40DRAFT_1162175 [Lentinula edodes]KAH7872538.1 hypothetical protein C8R40DRAFT_1162175 [Lentinula edodes]
MCFNLCLGFTGPFTKLEVCPYCGVKVSPYKDFFDGSRYIEKVVRGDVGENDIFLVLSIDGTHGFISGPGKPKNSDSFVFPGLYHLGAPQREGLRIWNAETGEIFVAYPHLALVTANGPAMAMLSGFVGHQGHVHSGASQYYPLCQKPDNYSISGSSPHYQANLAQIVLSSGHSQYEENQLATGNKQYTTRIPGLFAGDIMHLFTLNAPDLFIPLCRGKFECDKTNDLLNGDLWIEHGKCVAACTPYIPGSFN